MAFTTDPAVILAALLREVESYMRQYARDPLRMEDSAETAVSKGRFLQNAQMKLAEAAAWQRSWPTLAWRAHEVEQVSAQFSAYFGGWIMIEQRRRRAPPPRGGRGK